MPKFPPPKEFQFKPGQSGNPLGGKLHQPVIRALKRLTRLEVAEIGTIILENNLTELQRIVRDPTSSAFRVMMCTVILKTIARGDSMGMERILDQIVGKVKENVHLSGSVGITARYEAMTADQRAKRVIELASKALEPGEIDADESGGDRVPPTERPTDA